MEMGPTFLMHGNSIICVSLLECVFTKPTYSEFDRRSKHEKV
jgi:hypothetical protein